MSCLTAVTSEPERLDDAGAESGCDLLPVATIVSSLILLVSGISAICI